MRTYAYAYTANHDFSVCDDIMVPDYVLRMGPHEVRGRDEAYKPATAHQYEQYPGLGFTVHDLVTDGERVALRFSEHGVAPGRGAATWGGISMYRWDGSRLTECVVEQDYFSRRRQLRNGALPVEGPALDPWQAVPARANPDALACVSDWLQSGSFIDGVDVVLDDETWRPPARVIVDPVEVSVDELWSAGERVVYHRIVRGAYRGGLPGLDHRQGQEVVTYDAGIVEVADDEIISVRAVTDRLGVLRRLGGR
jgi:predicted ester cyclase